jgi:hypothetical protein
LEVELLCSNPARWLYGRCSEWWQAARRTREKLVRAEIQKALAEKRALSLLLNLLNQEQRHEFQADGYFRVTGGSSGDRYRIRSDSMVNIDVLGEDGTVRYHLCGRPTGNIPMYDVMAGQLLYLQNAGTETGFLAQAKRHFTMPYGAMVADRSGEQ